MHADTAAAPSVTAASDWQTFEPSCKRPRTSTKMAVANIKAVRQQGKRTHPHDAATYLRGMTITKRP